MKRCFRVVLLLFPFLAILVPASAQEEHQAGLVVDFGDGRVLVRVVSFAEETIGGVELLRRSGLDVATVSGAMGTAVCAIEGIGCPPTPQECFCRCRGSPCRYWAYFHLRDGGWVYADRGAADRRLGDGDVDGWVWVDGKTPPPLLTWEEIRAASHLPALSVVPEPSPTGEGSAPTSPPVLSPTRSPTPVARTEAPEGDFPAGLPTLAVRTYSPWGDVPARTLTPATRAIDTPRGYPLIGKPTSSLSPRSLSSAPATALPTETPSPADRLLSPSALAFGGMALLLLALGLWVRRRR